MAWVEVFESHTPNEWAYQLALSVVDPWGDARDDLRAALNTMASCPPSENGEEVFEGLTHYVKFEDDTCGFDLEKLKQKALSRE